MVTVTTIGCGSNTPDISAPIDPGTPSTVIADTDGIRTNLSLSNANWFPYGLPGTLKRRNLPIPLNLSGSTTAAEAANLMENKLEMVLFERGNRTDGIIINEGAGDAWCGNVSNTPGGQSLTVTVNNSGVITGTMYINVGSATCRPTMEIYAHELGHALGLGGHFAGFYDDVITRTPSIDGNFWNALLSLYSNPAGISIKHANILIKYDLKSVFPIF